MSTPPELKKIRAIDVQPGKWAVWCSVEGGAPFANRIDGRSWGEDGQYIWFMLDTHNFYKVAPDDEAELIPVVSPPEHYPNDQAAFLAKRPKRTEPCPTCNGCGRVAKVTPADPPYASPDPIEEGIHRSKRGLE